MASSDDGAKAPFLNDYKLQFFRKRFPQTLTGGLRLKIGAPCYIYFYQVIVFLWPAVLGGIFTALTEFDILQDNICCYVFGGLLLLTVVGVDLVKWYLTRESFTKGSQSSRHNVLADDNEVDFISCCDVDTFTFVFPANVNTLLRGPALALLGGMTFLCLLPSRLQDLGYSSGSTIVLLIFNWLTLCVACHSLTVRPPPETAIFRSLDVGLSSFMRPFYVASIAVVGVLARHYSCLEEVSKVLYIIMAILPLLWTVGLLPSLDALFPWLAEQILVFVLGGTYMASDSRLCIVFLLSAISFIPACFITNYLALATYSTAVGFLLSLDIFHITNCIINSLTKGQPRQSHVPIITTIVKYGVLVIVASIIAGITSHFQENATKSTFDYFGYVFVILLLLLKVLGDMQYVYVGMGLVRNPLYIKSATSVEKFKKFQHKIGYVGHIYNILLSYICPFFMVAFLGTFLNTSGDLSLFLKAIGTIRAMRWVWQNTSKCLLEVSICCVIVWTDIESARWNDLGIGLQLLFIGAITDRLHEFLTKMKFMLIVYITSWTEPKQRHSATVPNLIISLIFFPLILAVVFVSVALSSPLTPLFCFPIFFVGFPRPKRMWPSLASQVSNDSEGSVFYQQLVPKICHELQKTFASGTLVTRSDYLIVRNQDRLIVVHLLERGYRYCTLIARGLELQETSCHTVEATRVDDIFDEVFCKERATAFGLNPYPLHTLTPINCLVVKTYSDTHNVLTGIIDQPENIARQSSNFMKSLIWFLLNQHKKQTGKDCRESPTGGNAVCATLNTSEVTEFQDDIMVLQKTQTTLSDFESKETLQSIPVTKEKNSTSEKILPDTDWSDREWSENSDSSENEDDDSTKPLGCQTSGDDPLTFFGMPAQDIGSQTKLKSDSPHKTGKSMGIFPSRRITPISMDGRVEGTPQGAGCGFPSTWNSLLNSCRKYLPQIHSQFPEEWFGYVTSVVVGKSDHEVHLYREIAMYCYAVVNVCGLHGNVGPSHINKVFQGRVPWSPELDLLEQDSELKELVLKAYRYAFKLTYDEAVLGPVDDNDELLETLNDFEENWFIGIENKPEWNEAILQEKPNLFTIGYDAEKATYTSHLLTKQDLTLFTGTLNSEAVNGQWSSLAFELLYLTNDDEERYSIQAHPVLLRNLTMQAADPPLGYAVYSSGPRHVKYGLL